MFNYYEVEIKSTRINYYLNKLFKASINIYDLKYDKNKVIIKISYQDYPKLKSLLLTCDVKVIRTKGIKKYQALIRKYYIFLIFFILSVFFIIFLSKIIFFINININDENIKNIIKEELLKENITLYSYKKDIKDLNAISSYLMSKYKDKIEWLNIETKGVTYNVSIILKEIKDNKKDDTYYDLVAKENGYIIDMDIKSGNIIKNKGDYVEKGEVIVSSKIMKDDEVVAYKSAKGNVYAEVWYQVKVSSPFQEKIEKKSDTYTEVISLTIFNFHFNIYKYQSKKNISKELYHGIFFNINKTSSENIDKKLVKYSKELLLKTLSDKALNKIKQTLSEKEYIISQKTLKNEVDSDKMYLEVFYKVYKSIALEKESIVEEKEVD